MSTAEYPDHMSKIEPTDTQDQVAAFAKLHGASEKLHTAELSEIERFKSIMDRLISIESDITLIKKHFNIVEIIGQQSIQEKP